MKQQKIISYRNITLDIFKFLACLGVVCIHFANDSPFIVFLKTCVPFYFLVSGFLSANIYDKEDRLTKLKKQIIMLSFYTLLAFFVTIIYSVSVAGGFELVFKLSGHLWFLGTLTIVNILYFFACKYNKTKLLYHLAFPLLSIGICINLSSYWIFNTILPHVVARNALFYGLPFFMIGVYVSKKKISFDNIYVKIALLISAIGFTLLQYYEGKLVGQVHDLLITSIFSSILLFLFAISFKINIPKETYMKFVGRNYTLYIYLFHQIITDFGIRICNLNYVYGFVLTAVVCYIFQQIITYCKKFLV